MKHKIIRVLMAKCGLDGHDRGVKVIARALRDAGMEVIYTGLHQTPEQVVKAAIEEDVDVIGISILSGAHMTIFPRILELLKQAEAAEIPVLGGGTIIDPDEIQALKAMGVQRIVGPDTPIDEIVEHFREAVRSRAIGKDRQVE
ncbi:MAG: cobalamin B12-binding domain-containing protein [Candidatus Methylomirabilales bacterium]